jgi:macrolide transport system ATP-binding/permease protein
MKLPIDTPLLTLKNIQRYYPNGDTVVKALDDVSLTIWPGEFVAIIGQSGSGKSTLMNLIGCLDKADTGSYRVLNEDVAGLDSDQLAALRREIFGFVFQRYNLLHTASAAENIEIPALYAGLSKSERHSRAIQLLDRLGLGDRSAHTPMQLSGGQQQRVAIARALMNNPPVILADEPTGALDSESGKDVMALLADLHREGRTILLITHDEKVAAHAQRIVVLRDGKIVSDGAENRSGHLMALDQQGKGHVGITTELLEAAKTALRSLQVNLFRTALTLLGIVIGVAAVVTMLAVGQGSQEKVLDQMRAMGTNILSIRPGAPGLRASTDVATLTPADADVIAEQNNVEWTSPERSSRLTVRYGNIDYLTSIQGVAPSMTEVRDWTVAKGDFFDERDLRSYAPVIVLGETVKQILFPDSSDPLGSYVMVGNIPFEVVGVMDNKGADAQGNDRDDVVFVPLTTGMIRLFGQNYLGGITVKVRDVEQIESTQQLISDLLVVRHQTEDFRIRNMASILATTAETQNTFTLMLGIVAAISLLVGGIGVMNIMLVSVTERTREIGIRMATGARRRDILLQFNTEAAVVCTIGGLMGVLLGFAAGTALRYFDMAVIFSPLPAILAFSCAFGTGLLFGFLPARKAAHLDPVVALAAE